MWHVTCDRWHVTSDRWQVTGDTWHVTHDTKHIVWDENSLKISALQLFRFGIDSVWKIFELKDHSMNQLINDWMSNGGDCRTAPATPGLLMINCLFSCMNNTTWYNRPQPLSKCNLFFKLNGFFANISAHMQFYIKISCFTWIKETFSKQTLTFLRKK